MTWDQYEQFLLALCCWREARGESQDGQLAVMHVIRNRVKAWAKTWYEVITADAQFSSMNPAGHTYDSQLEVWPAPWDTGFAWILSQAALIYGGGGDDPTGGGLYYWNPATQGSEWFKKNVAEKRTKLAVIGKHEFFA